MSHPVDIILFANK